MKVAKKTRKNSVNGNRRHQTSIALLGQTSVSSEDNSDRHQATRTKIMCCICSQVIQDDRQRSVWCHRGGWQHLGCSTLKSIKTWTRKYECKKFSWCVAPIRERVQTQTLQTTELKEVKPEKKMTLKKKLSHVMERQNNVSKRKTGQCS